ncbi:MAG: hypothetical protein L7F78_19490 [Syntrophales bacterium LBB04]|nr:hypothetical protein [Syntrophales bacterium LBB04]
MNIVKGIDRIAVVLAIIATIPGFMIGWSYLENSYQIRPSDVQWNKPFINPNDVIWDQEESEKGSSVSIPENKIETPLSRFRTKYPCYNELTDEELSRALHKKYYSDLTFEDFSSRIGYKLKTSGDVFDQVSFEMKLRPEKWKLISSGIIGAVVSGFFLFLFITISTRLLKFVFLWICTGFKDKS